MQPAELIRKSTAQSGPELRTGAISVTTTGTHYDGGWTSAGIFGFYTCPTNVWLTGSGPDEPEAVWNFKREQATWIDHGAFFITAPLLDVYPALPDKHLAYNFELLDSSVRNSVNVPGSLPGEFDGNIMHYVK